MTRLLNLDDVSVKYIEDECGGVTTTLTTIEATETCNKLLEKLPEVDSAEELLEHCVMSNLDKAGEILRLLDENNLTNTMTMAERKTHAAKMSLIISINNLAEIYGVVTDG